jgi:hypothetical protein
MTSNHISINRSSIDTILTLLIQHRYDDEVFETVEEEEDD